MESVSEAAVKLDEKCPGWHEKINVGTLDLGKFDRCILAQAFGGYSCGSNTMKLLDEEIKYFNDDKTYRDEWIYEIKFRLMKDKVTTMKKPYILYQIAECGSWAGEGLYPSEQQFLAEAALQARIHCDNNGIDRIVVVPFSAKPYTIEKNGWVEVR